ncbi:MAG: amino-acid N-acetyltransferase, partial [Methylococcales bacterium]
DVFNLSAEAVATDVAIALQADKLILMTEENCLNETTQQLIPQLTVSEASAFLTKASNHSLKPSLTAAIKACEENVDRVHLINRHLEGGLLLELFSRNGVGTLISANSYEKLRTATTHDIPGILDLIRPLEAENKLIKRSREHIEIDIENYSILERDGLIIGCIALNTFPNTTIAEVACLAVHPNYQHAARGQQLLSHTLTQAKQKKLRQVIAFSTQSSHWFFEHGFLEVDLASIAEIGIKPQQIERKAKILHKQVR